MFTITSEYALRALVSLALAGDGAMLRTRELAERTNIPSSYLSKILTTLCRQGLLEGSRGIRGGYRLIKKPEELLLIDVIELFEIVRPENPCIFGRTGGCDENDPCGIHDEWQRVRQPYARFLESTTIADLARNGQQTNVEPREQGRDGHG